MKIRKSIISIFDFIKNLLFCLKLACSASKFYTFMRLLYKIVVPISGIFSAYILKLLLDTINESKNWNIIMLLCLSTLIINFIITGLNQINIYVTKMHDSILDNKINLLIMDKALNADLKIFDDSDYYDKFTIAQRDSQAFSFILWSTVDFISALVSIFGTFAIICQSNMMYGVLLILATIPVTLATRQYTKLVYELSVDQINDERKKQYLSYISSQKEYAQSIRLYNIKAYIKEKYTGFWLHLFLAKKKMIKPKTVMIGLLQFIPDIVIWGITLHIIFRIIEGEMSIGDVTLYTGLLTQLSAGIIATINNAMEIYDNKMQMDNIKSFQMIPQDVQDTGNLNIEEIEEIEFCNVSFIYPGTRCKVLKDISFKIKKNEKVALVGINGSGKSTLIKLLLRFYDPTEGVILLNGINLREYKIESVRACFDVYFQNNYNFGFTISENIAIGKKKCEIDYKKMNEAIKIAGVDNIVNTAKYGIDTYLTRMFDESGIEISIGQHQKVALARTFYRDKHVLLLDEPSSALDPEAESAIFDAIEEMGVNKTILFTSHRLTNLYLSDWIIVLENGRIIERGNKNKLLQRRERFAELYEYQAEKFK